MSRCKTGQAQVPQAFDGLLNYSPAAAQTSTWYSCNDVEQEHLKLKAVTCQAVANSRGIFLESPCQLHCVPFVNALTREGVRELEQRISPTSRFKLPVIMPCMKPVRSMAITSSLEVAEIITKSNFSSQRGKFSFIIVFVCWQSGSSLAGSCSFSWQKESTSSSFGAFHTQNVNIEDMLESGNQINLGLARHAQWHQETLWYLNILLC